jgi:hypothetical protein
MAHQPALAHAQFEQPGTVAFLSASGRKRGDGKVSKAAPRGNARSRLHKRNFDK